MTLRELIIDWLTSSRYVKWLETQHQEQRQDYTERLSEKDSQIKHLRVELAGTKLECDRMRAVLMPFGSPSGSAYAQKFEITATPPVVPAFDGPDDWQAELNKMYQKEQRNDGLQPESTSGQEDNLQPLQPQDS
jgi:hypothetical protein